jgi:pimeloyl-ACP methyl ester carboxylesterase
MEEFNLQQIHLEPESMDQPVPITVHRHGTGSHLALVMHGLGACATGFERALEVFAPSDWTLVVPDFPGHGQSGGQAWYPCTPDWYCFVMEALVRQMNREPSLVMGHSMGGTIGLLLCETLPGNPFLLNVEGLPENLGFLQRRIRRYGDMDPDRGLQKWREEFQGVSDDGIQAWVEWTRSCDPRVFFESARRFVELWEQQDMMERFRSYPGDRRFYICGEHGQSPYVQETLEENAFGIIPGAAHFPMTTHADAFWSMCRDVLKQRVRPTLDEPEPFT